MTVSKSCTLNYNDFDFFDVTSFTWTSPPNHLDFDCFIIHLIERLLIGNGMSEIGGLDNLYV